MKTFAVLALVLITNGHSIYAVSSNLIDHSPFMPIRSSQPVPVNAPLVSGADTVTSFKLKGVIKSNGSYQFSILDTRTDTSYWVSPNEPINGFKILSYDPAKHLVHFSWNGRTGQTSLATTSNAVLKVTQSISGEQRKSVTSNAASTQVKGPTTGDPYRQSTGLPTSRNQPFDQGSNPRSGNTTTTDSGIIFFGGSNSRTSGTQTDPTTNAGENTGSEQSQTDTITKTKFANENTDASGEEPNVEPDTLSDNTEPEPARFKVRRINTVENANGKQPI